MARPKYPSDEVDKTMVRFPPGLMDRLKTSAAENHRSMNAEIIARLEASFMHPLGQDPASFPAAGAIAEEIMQRLNLKDIARLAEEGRRSLAKKPKADE